MKKPDETKEDALEKAGMAAQGTSEALQESTASPVTMDTIPSMPIQIKSVEVSNAPTMRIPSKHIEEEMQKEQEVKIDLPEIPLAEAKEEDIQVKTPDMGKFNTINLQKELAKNLAEVMQQEDMDATDATRALPIESIQDFAEGAKEADEEQTSEDAPEAEQTKEPKPIADTAVTRAVIEEVRKALGEESQDTITEEDLLQSLAEPEAATIEPEQPAAEEEAVPVESEQEAVSEEKTEPEMQPVEEEPIAPAVEQTMVEESLDAPVVEQPVEETPEAEPEAKAEPEIHVTEEAAPVVPAATAEEQLVEETPVAEPEIHAAEDVTPVAAAQRL